jgi:hypothetical protein
MAERVIKVNQSITPFLSERMNFIGGLDPMGLQNTSTITFATLLPGLNNVTRRVRYYSFYCWLLDVYAKEWGDTDPQEQRLFIRKAEYLIALAGQFYETEGGSIAGSQYASLLLEKPDVDVISLNDAILNQDGSTNGTYWKYSWGAFGQYYLGSLRAINIVTERGTDETIYVRTNSRETQFVSGEMLANAFNDNVGSNAKKLFLDAVRQGEVKKDQLKELLPDFNLTLIPEESEEQAYLTQLLLQKDYPLRIEEKPSTFRKNSIGLLLDYAASAPETMDDRAFTYFAYHQKGRVNGEQELNLYGWYYYQFNEFWQYANTAILNGVLHHLMINYGLDWVALPNLIQEVAEAVITDLIEEGYLSSSSSTLADSVAKELPQAVELVEQIRKAKGTKRVMLSVLLIFSLYKHNTKELIELKEYGEQQQLARDGEASGYYTTRFSAKINVSVKEYLVQFLHKHTIYRHQYVAFRKIGGGNQTTQKFILEENHIRYIDNFDPAYTGPRIESLLGFLTDLNILSSKGELKDYGKSVQKELSADGN